MLKATLLVVEDENALLRLFTRRLERLAYKVLPTDSGAKALEILKHEAVDLLITDFKMPGMNGSEIISRATTIDPMLQSIMVTGYSDLKTAIDVMGAGAFNYLSKPVDFDELDITIQKGLEKRKLLQEIHNKQIQLEEYRHHLEDLVVKRTEALIKTNQSLKKEIEERKHLEISLREAKAVAEHANRTKSEFLANMSHEIRTPMTSAIGLLDLVLDTDLLPKQKTYLEMARVSTVVMHNLLNDILDFSKIEAGKLNLESISFDPRTVIASVIDLQHFQAKEKKIKLCSIIDGDVPASVIGDPNRLRQIVLNLISNALKFTHYGEVTIHCKNAEENLYPTSAKGKYSFLHFSVQDSGIGIEKEKIELIFEAFTQADSSTTREYGGVGLGLNICTKLVEMMQGRIWVTSEFGQGSTFHFICRFGADQSSDEMVKELEMQKPTSSGEPQIDRPLAVLLAEGNRTNQWIFRELLQKQGHAVVAVSDGVTTVHEVANRSFDLMLLDYQLPDIDCCEVVHLIRSHEGKKNGQCLPIIGMTGLIDENEQQKYLNAGLNDLIAKPFTADQLFAKIWKHLPNSPNTHTKKIKKKEQARPNIKILETEIFNEAEALKKAGGNREIMIKRIKAFLQNTPHYLELLQKNIIDNQKMCFEREIHHLNELSMEIGAINFADQLFSILMNLRKKQAINTDQINAVIADFEIFSRERNIRILIGE